MTQLALCATLLARWWMYARYGFANGVQEDAFGVVPLPNGESSGGVRPLRTCMGSNVTAPRAHHDCLLSCWGYALAERRALAYPSALTFNGETLYIGFNTHLRQFGYHAVDPSTLTVQTTTITGSDGYLLEQCVVSCKRGCAERLERERHGAQGVLLAKRYLHLSGRPLRVRASRPATGEPAGVLVGKR